LLPREATAYTGREFDPDTSLYYYRARWYDPQVGRFISEDPVAFAGGHNWYTYVSDNPVNLTDPSGLWETEAHNEIIDQAFKNCLTESQRQQLKDASQWVDRGENQFADTAYQHGMRAPWQSIDDARKATNKFISDYEGAARNAFPNGCKDGYGKIPWNALWEFGKALHTLTDMSSPSHQGFQIWNDPPRGDGSGSPLYVLQLELYAAQVARHHARETLGKLKGDPTRLQMIKKIARDEFAKTFGNCGCCED
jgi:RHS repeat-associated protein